MLAGVRDALAELRRVLPDEFARAERVPDEEAQHARALDRATALARRAATPTPRPVINATGVVLHTNLGRAPIAPGAAEAAAAAAAGYSNLELDLETGARGNRLGSVTAKLELLSGAPGAYACNNCAAALMLALDTMARGREVVVSRGELVEIGGSFRVPDIMERAGVRLVEVGTTNRTHPRDYENAIGPDTALLLKVHRSNFALQGFTKEVSLGELVEIGRRRGVPVAEDLGSGSLVNLEPHGFPSESYAPARFALGADLVCFSGDKLLGGPQAGLVLGSADVVAAMRKNPLARALRLDKLSLAALDWTLGALLAPDAVTQIPALRHLLAQPSALEPRARAFAGAIEREVGGCFALDVQPDKTPVGGGSLPEVELDGWVVALRCDAGPDRLAALLRAAEPPVMARVRDDALLVDLRTVDPSEEAALLAALAAAAAALD